MKYFICGHLSTVLLWMEGGLFDFKDNSDGHNENATSTNHSILNQEDNNQESTSVSFQYQYDTEMIFLTSAVALHIIKAMKCQVAKKTIYPLSFNKPTVVISYINPKILIKSFKI